MTPMSLPANQVGMPMPIPMVVQIHILTLVFSEFQSKKEPPLGFRKLSGLTEYVLSNFGIYGAAFQKIFGTLSS